MIDQAFENNFYRFAKDKNGKYLYINDYSVCKLGLNHPDDIVGLSDYDLAVLTEVQAQQLQQNDKKVVTQNKTVIFIESVTIVNNEKIFLVSQKSPLYSKTNKLIGIHGVAFPIYNPPTQDLSSLNSINQLLSLNFKHKYKLSERQYLCLDFLLKGLTAKQIGKIMHLSPRTVEHYINILKIKLHCSSRQEIIAKYISAELFLD